MAYTSLAPYAVPLSVRTFPYTKTEAEEEIPTIDVAAPTRYTTVFQGLRSKFEEIQSLNYLTSGYNLNSADQPYGILLQLANTFEGRDSQLQRFEHGIYKFSVFDQNMDTIYRLVEEIKTEYNWSTIRMNDSFIVNEIAITGDSIGEVSLGFFRGDISFETKVQKAPNIANITTRTFGDNFLHAIEKRADQFSLSQFTTGKYRLNFDDYNYDPIITIGHYTSNEFGRTTTTQQMTTKFTMNVFSPDLDDLERKMFEVDEIYDLCRLVVADKWLLVCEWVSDEKVEAKPGIFQGMINFDIVTEESITPGA